MKRATIELFRLLPRYKTEILENRQVESTESTVTRMPNKLKHLETRYKTRHRESHFQKFNEIKQRLVLFYRGVLKSVLKSFELKSSGLFCQKWNNCQLD